MEETKKKEWEIYLEGLLKQSRHTDEEKAFLKARKEEIDPKVFKALELEEEDEEIDLDKLNIKKLTALAKDQNIDLGEAKNKEEIIEAIEQANA